MYFLCQLGSFSLPSHKVLLPACLPACPPACFPACLPAHPPACLPAVRPTSGWRIGPVFSYHTEYWCANTDLLFRLRFIHYAIVNPFILACLPFPLNDEQNGERMLKRCRWIVWLLLIKSHYLPYTCVLDCIIHYYCYQQHCCCVPIQVSLDDTVIP